MKLTKSSYRNSIVRFLCVIIITLTGMSSVSAQSFKQEQLDQLLAPIALYPDALLSQVLMAATYPDNVAQAAQWSRNNPKTQGDAAVNAVASQPWDPSVQSLVAFPQVLASMSAKPDWVQQVGDAFLDQPDTVMDTVQKLRQAAYKSGNLKSNSQQTVEAQSSNTIVIQPADPQVVYVPSYNPSVVYGSWWYPSYPPVYFPAPTGFGYGVISGIGFGVGIAVTNSLWGGWDWGHHRTNINVNRYNRINVNHPVRSSSWNHNPSYRGNRPYHSSSSRQRYQSSANVNRSGLGSSNSNNYRGFDKNSVRDQERQRARSSMNDRGGLGSSSSRPALQNTQSRPSTSNWPKQSNAISGSRDSKSEIRSQRDRGVSSSRSISNSSRQQQSFSRPSGGRTGGGGSRSFRRR